MNQTSAAPVAPLPYGSRLVLDADGFTYAGKRYLYQDVRHVEFEHASRRLSNENVAAAWEYSSRLRVSLASGKWMAIRLISLVRVTQKTTIKAWHDRILQTTEQLSARTFDVRMDALNREITARKYMVQGVYQVATNGDLFKRYAYCLNMRSEHVNNLLFPDRLVSVRKPKRWWKRILWSLVHSGEAIDLTRDRDCFLYFLRYYTGLYWPNEPLRLWRGKAADGRIPATGGTQAGADSGSGKEREVPVQPKPVATSVQHLASLNLEADAKWEEVRTTYRKLARQYHPDLMRGRGESAEAIAKAEEALKRINQAYGWLEDFYRLKPKR